MNVSHRLLHVIVATCALALSACATRQPEATPAEPGATPAPAAAAAPARPDVASAAPSAPPAASAATSSARRTAPGDTSVFFEFDSSALSDRGRDLVTRHGDYLVAERHPIRIEGNADERGSREYNIALGQRRAEAVRQMLVLRGVGGDRVEAVSYGEERPRCTRQSEDCFSENRRADFVYQQR